MIHESAGRELASLADGRELRMDEGAVLPSSRPDARSQGSAMLAIFASDDDTVHGLYVCQALVVGHLLNAA